MRKIAGSDSTGSDKYFANPGHIFYVFFPRIISVHKNKIDPEKNNPLRLRLIELAGRLACPDKRFSDWAKAIGVNCGKIEKDEKEDLINELDAVVANLYGLSRNQLIHIFETFHVGSDYHEKLEATLKYYQK